MAGAPWRLVLGLLAMVCFLVSAYLTIDMSARLRGIGLAALALAFSLS